MFAVSPSQAPPHQSAIVGPYPKIGAAAADFGGRWLANRARSA